MDWQHLLAFFLGSVVTFALSWYLFERRFLRLKRGQERELWLMRNRAQKDQNEAQLILASIEMGVLAYGWDGKLMSSNEAARMMLPDIPGDFQSFLEAYGEPDNLSSSLMLGHETAQMKYRLGEQIFNLTVQSHTAVQEQSKGHFILIRDITQSEREARRQRDFVANVSHELSTPLTTIKSYSETLIDWGISEKSREQLIKDVKRIYDDSLRMEKLITDLLLLSKIDAQGYTSQVRIEALEPVWVVKNCCEQMQMQAQAKQISLTCTAVAQIPTIYAARSTLEQILTNLLSNAIKYTQERGEVQVYIGFLVDDVYVKVKDNGLGIDQSEQAHIFDRFYRVDNSGSRQHGGTGLGLSIVRELVDLMQGSITVQSALTKGSEFTLMLPCTNKSMRQALYELTQTGETSNAIAAVAARDVAALAQSLGIMAQWKSLQTAELKAILARIEEVTRPDSGQIGSRKSGKRISS